MCIRPEGNFIIHALISVSSAERPCWSDCSLPPQVTAAQWLELMTAGGMSQGGADTKGARADTDGVRADADDMRADRFGVRVAPKGSVDSAGDAAGTNETNAETPETVGMLVLSDPYFAEVDSFMRRFHNVLPASKVVGGAVKAGEALFSGGTVHSGGAAGIILRGRDLHSSIFQLNVSASCGKGGACRGRLRVVLGCLGGVREYEGVFGVCFCVRNGSR